MVDISDHEVVNRWVGKMRNFAVVVGVIALSLVLGYGIVQLPIEAPSK